MKTRNNEAYEVTRANTERFKNSSILHMHRFYNVNKKKEDYQKEAMICEL